MKPTRGHRMNESERQKKLGTPDDDKARLRESNTSVKIPKVRITELN